MISVHRACVPGLLAALATAAGAAAGTGPADVRGADLALLESVRNVARTLEGLLGVTFPQPPVAVRADASLRRMSAEVLVGRSIPSDRLDARGRAWADIGLGPPDAPRVLYEALAADLDGIALDPVRLRLFVDPSVLSATVRPEEGVSGEAATLLMATGRLPDEPLAAHYLVHRLQWAPEGGVRLEDTTDRLLAGSAWREGTANAVALHYLFEGLGVAREVLERELDPGEVLGGRLMHPLADPDAGAVGRMLDWVYRDGYVHAVRLYREGGWRAVSSAMRRRRETSALLHPDRAASGAVSAAEAEGTSVVDRDQVGEWAIAVLVAEATGKENLGLMAGDGWRADALERLEDPGPGAPGHGRTRWRTWWRDPEEASEFVEIYLRALEARFGAALPPDSGSRDGMTLRAPGDLRTWTVRRSGVTVTVDVSRDPSPPSPASHE